MKGRSGSSSRRSAPRVSRPHPTRSSHSCCPRADGGVSRQCGIHRSRRSHTFGRDPAAWRLLCGLIVLGVKLLCYRPPYIPFLAYEGRKFLRGHVSRYHALIHETGHKFGIFENLFDVVMNALDQGRWGFARGEQRKPAYGNELGNEFAHRGYVGEVRESAVRSYRKQAQFSSGHLPR